MKTHQRVAPLAFGVAALSLAACFGEQQASESHTDDHPIHWGYEADNGPDHWGSMNPEWSLCAEGRQQSPIDLADATKMETSGAVIDRPSHVDETTTIDNGRTIQVKAKTGETFTVGDKTFALLQYHFHAPSEHTVDGEHFPMEMHFVHQADDGALAVVGVLVEEGAPNPGIASLWAQLPEAPGAATPTRS